MAYTQKSDWPGLLGKGKQPKEGSRRDIRQKKRILGKAGESLTGDFTEADVTAVDTARTDYETAFQKRAELKDFSQRKRARLEKKTGIELSNTDVKYTGKEAYSSNETLDRDKQITDIDETKFKNTYNLKGEYTGTKKRKTQIGGSFESDYTPPTPEEKEVEEELKPRNTKPGWNVSRGKYTKRNIFTGKVKRRKKVRKSKFFSGTRLNKG